MTTPPATRRILMVAPKREAQPVLSQLRSSGHQVSLVEDLDEAGAMLGISGFDQAVLQGSSLEILLEQRMVWEGADGEGWRRSTAAIVHDLRGLLSALATVMRDVQNPPRDNDEHAVGALADTVDSLSCFADELMQELVNSSAVESLRSVDLEDVAEAAAIVVYPSASERRQRLTIDIDPEVATITSAPARLKRALKNLLEFASVRAPEQGSVAIRAVREGGDCIISVSCENNAVDRSEVARLASSLSGYRHRLGPLALTQELLEQLQGRLWIESERDGGVKLFIALPQTWNRGALASARGHGGPALR